MCCDEVVVNVVGVGATAGADDVVEDVRAVDGGVGVIAADAGDVAVDAVDAGGDTTVHDDDAAWWRVWCCVC